MQVGIVILHRPKFIETLIKLQGQYLCLCKMYIMYTCINETVFGPVLENVFLITYALINLFFHEYTHFE